VKTLLTYYRLAENQSGQKYIQISLQNLIQGAQYETDTLNKTEAALFALFTKTAILRISVFPNFLL
jgi:hypothetical protein